jgi:hypothetical protein
MQRFDLCYIQEGPGKAISRRREGWLSSTRATPALPVKILLKQEWGSRHRFFTGPVPVVTDLIYVASAIQITDNLLSSLQDPPGNVPNCLLLLTFRTLK